jgi:hypothetical protein
MNAPAHRSLPTWLVALVAAAVFVLASFCVGGDPVDDAGITFRFAHNLAEGKGLCFNPGEPVEGYVHFLWIVLLAAIKRMSGLEPMAVGPGLGRLFGALTVAGTAFVAARLRSPRGGPFWIAAPFLLATNLYFLLWSQAGLETPLFTCLLVLSLHLHLRGGLIGAYGTPLVLVALCMTRPEGVLVVVVLAVESLLARPRSDRRAVAVALTFLLPAGVYFLWRWHYFGYFLPNVFYAKAEASFEVGLLYLGYFLLRNEPRVVLPQAAGILVLVVTLIPLGFALPRLIRPRIRVLSAIVVVWAIGILVEGGDWMGGFRFVVPVIPVLALVAATAADRLAGKRGARTALAGLLVVVPFTFNVANGAAYAALPTSDPRRTWFHQRAYYDDAARWVKANVPAGSLVALGDVGYIPYATPEVRYIDFLGLVDPVIAHLDGGITNPEVYRYIWERKPDYFLSIVHRRPDGRLEGHTPVDATMLRFLDPKLAPEKRLFVKVAELEGWHDDGDEVSFYIYARAKGR